VGPLAWFAVQGVIDQQVVRAVWADGRLCCDRLLEVRARLLVDLGAEFSSEILHAGTTPASRPRRWRCC
jgi:hypothetical protein